VIVEREAKVFEMASKGTQTVCKALSAVSR